MTLTIAASTDPLADQLKHLMTSFRKLREQKYWKKAVKGGIYAIEITWHPPTERWHPHLHVIYDGVYYPHELLKDQWHEVTGDSYIVDIRPVHERDQAARYIARYVAKPMDVLRWPASAIREFAAALHGKRMIHTFGTLHGAAVDPKPDEPSSGSSSYVVPVRHLIEAAGAGIKTAQRAVAILREWGGTWRVVIGEPTWEVGEQLALSEDLQPAAALEGAADAARWISMGRESPGEPPPIPDRHTQPLFTKNESGLDRAR